MFQTPSYFRNAIPFHGGRHTLVAFILAACSILSLNLKAILSATFGKVLINDERVKYPNNLWVLRNLTEEMLRYIVRQNPEII